MASAKTEVTLDFPPFLRLYKDRSIERLCGTEIIRPTIGISAKDVIIDTDSGVYVRVYIPHVVCLASKEKLPLVVYIHGGGFCVEAPESLTYHTYVSSVVSEANVVAVSIGYRRPPEYIIPTAHNDSWTALKWVSSHAKGEGTEPWLNTFADPNRVFIVGDSAGANIVHNVTIRAMQTPLEGIKIVGLALFHPYFSGNKPVKSELKQPETTAKASQLWSLVACPGSDNDHPLLNPAVNDYTLENFPCEKVLVCVAGNDVLRDRGLLYASFLKERGFPGAVETFESANKGHVFHLVDNDEKALALMKCLVSFIHEKKKADLPKPQPPVDDDTLCNGSRKAIDGTSGASA